MKTVSEEQSVVFKQPASIIKWGLLLCFLLLIISRNTLFFTDPRFWAEEATLYFLHAYNHSLSEQLSYMAAGYYNIINVMSTAMAYRLVPLESAPIVTTIIALAFQLLPAHMILFANIQSFADIRIKILALMLLLFMVPNQEVWLNVINSQFYLSIATALILVHSSRNSIEKITYYIILFFSGLSGVISLFLFPLFVVRAVTYKEREKWIQVIILLCAGLIQAYLILTSDNGLRGGDFYGPIFVFIFILKVILLPIFGADITASIVPFIKQVLLETPFIHYFFASVIGVFFWFLFKFIKHFLTTDARYWFASSFILFFFCVYGALGDNTQLVSVDSGSGARYFIAPNILFYFSMLALLSASPMIQLNTLNAWRKIEVKWTVQIIIVLVIIQGMLSFWSNQETVSMKGPSWKQQVMQSQDGYRKIMIWPKGWFLNLNQYDNQMLEQCQKNEFMGDDLLCIIYTSDKFKIKILFLQSELYSTQYDLLHSQTIQNLNPKLFPSQVIYSDVFHSQSNSMKTVKLKLFQDGVALSAILIEEKQK